jgi:hypothetical protein
MLKRSNVVTAFTEHPLALGVEGGFKLEDSEFDLNFFIVAKNKYHKIYNIIYLFLSDNIALAKISSSMLKSCGERDILVLFLILGEAFSLSPLNVMWAVGIFHECTLSC